MKQLFTTKRDINGNRCHLVIDHDTREYSRHFGGWFHPEDATATVTRKALREMVETLKADGYTGRDVLHL